MEERRAREANESVCEELAREISCWNSEICRMRKEIEERNMLRIREKSDEAKFLFESEKERGKIK